MYCFTFDFVQQDNFENVGYEFDNLKKNSRVFLIELQPYDIFSVRRVNYVKKQSFIKSKTFVNENVVEINEITHYSRETHKI